MTSTEDIESGHQDRVTVVHCNFDGSKFLTASIDHKIKVWTVDRATNAKELLETFTAHDADIRDAKWLHSSTGSHIATVGNDLKFHLWQEEPLQAPRSGRRFRKIFTIASKPQVPFVSLDLKNIDNIYTTLALIDRQGLLSIYEPVNADDFKDWTLVDRFNVCTPPPGRNEQTCFKVRFDQNIIPLPYINCLSDDRRQLGLVATAMSEVKIYRSVTSDTSHGAASDHADSLHASVDEASRRIQFYEAANLPVHPALVRDVQWAPFNVRGSDLFATACKDGAVRIFEMQVSENTEHVRSAKDKSADHASQLQGSKTTVGNSLRPKPVQQSSLTSAITLRNQAGSDSLSRSATNPAPQSHEPSSQNQGVSTNQQQQQSAGMILVPATTTTTAAAAALSSTAATQNRNDRATHRFAYKHIVTTQANLLSAHTDAWSVHWDPSGQVLISGGDDGVTKIWRRGVLALDTHHHQSQRAKVHEQHADVNDHEHEHASETGTNTLQKQQQQRHAQQDVVGGAAAAAAGNVGGAGATEGLPAGGGRWMLFADQAVEFGSGSGDDNSDRSSDAE